MAKISNLTELTSATDTSEIVINDGTPTTKKITVANLKASLGLPLYTICLELDQSGTNAPTISEVFNNSGVTVTSVYGAAGQYTLNLSSPIMTTGKTIVTSTSGVLAPYILGIIRQNESSIDISTYSTSDVFTNFQLRRTGIKIEVYA